MGYQYGNYTGGGWTGGENVAPGVRGNFDIKPITPTDALARAHDWSYANADTAKAAGDMQSYQAIIIAADRALLAGAIAQHKVLDLISNPTGDQVLEWRVSAQIETAFRIKISLFDTDQNNINLSNIQKYNEPLPPLPVPTGDGGGTGT